ncbi:MAG: PQQ-binding-like beta-propeller repeat protein [Victivallaceae bacterium]|nr:PQQ-binding-like beta-propeller repeat protein [Victivallaceae bacterium]
MKNSKKMTIIIVFVLLISAIALMLLYCHEPLTEPAGSPILSYNSTAWPIFRGDRQLTGYVKSIPENPKVAWRFRAEEMVDAGPVFSNNRIYFGDTEGTFYCLELHTGKPVWQKKISDGISASALLLSGVCYVGSQSGEFFALSMADGKLLWRYKCEGQISGSANYFMEQGQLRIIFGSYDFKLHCLDAKTGKELWSVPTGNYINGAPAVEDNRIVFGGCDGYLRTIDAGSGKEQLKLKLKSYIPASPAIYDSITYVALYGQKILAINGENKILWSYASDADAAFLSSPAVNREVVVIGDRDGLVHILNRVDGEKIAEFQTAGDIAVGPIISDKRGLVTDKDGFIYIFDLATGKEIWNYQLGPAITAPPAICGNKIIIADNNGNITAFTK